jgi:hypothetical protein
MKTSIFLLGLMLITVTSMAQTRNPASACGSGCDLITVTVKNNKACGSSSDHAFNLSNNSNQSLDVVMFVEKQDGGWRDLGLLDNFKAGDSKKEAFWACGITGRYLLYYRVAGSNDKFPNVREINAKRN